MERKEAIGNRTNENTTTNSGSQHQNDDRLIGALENQGTIDHQRNIVAYVNHFLTELVDFLNKFVKKCESKLINIDHRLEKIRNDISLIEFKVNGCNTG